MDADRARLMVPVSTLRAMPKIEFWRTIGETYRFVFGDIPRFARVSGMWLAGAILGPILSAYVVSGIQASHICFS
jgi:hypothetical protein